MYIIKVKGKAKNPRLYQIRRWKTVLIAYFPSRSPFEKNMGEILVLEGKEEELEKPLDQRLSFGKLQKN